MINVADIASTYEGLKYSCVSEVNPLLTKKPSLERLILHKISTIYLLYHEYPEWANYTVRQQDIETMFWLLNFVVYNNHDVVQYAKDNPEICQKTK
tara:strand:+ start:6852 stop:7139 length:288 start_codon:yes stop_codon:yes gene_type:complete